MTGKNVFSAFMAVLMVVALMMIAYQSGTGQNGNTPEAVREVIDKRLASLDGFEERVKRLEEEVVSLRDAPSANALDGTGKVALEFRLSTLQQRIKGLEEDPRSAWTWSNRITRSATLI